MNSSQIRCLYEDRQTNLWIGTENGGIAVAKAGKLTNVAIGQGSYAGRLTAICEDRNGAVLLYTDRALLARYRDGKVDVRPVGLGAASLCWALIADDSGGLWAGTDRRARGLGVGAQERRVRVQAGPAVHQHRAGRRDQPHHAQETSIWFTWIKLIQDKIH